MSTQVRRYVCGECGPRVDAEDYDALLADCQALRAALTDLLEAELAPMPLLEAGVEAQNVWADRRAAARNNARALLTPGESHVK
jgi:hypothetical protein